MRILGIIAEYNPFHTGHGWQIEEARRKAGADFVIAVMSGSFVQRGEPAIWDKSVRTRLALMGGADVVLEMPAPFSSAAAGDFARFGVSLLDALGTDVLCFGSESGDLSLLERIAEVMILEPPAFRTALQQHLKEGKAFPDARARAVCSALSDTGTAPEEPCNAGTSIPLPELESLLREPNNILGLEYLTALARIGSSMEACTIRREGSSYHAETLPEDRFSEESPNSPSPCRPFASATALRGRIQDHDLTEILPYLPSGAFSLLMEEPALGAEDLSGLLNGILFREPRMFTDYEGFDEALSDRLSHLEPAIRSFPALCAELKTRNCTYRRISRALLHLILGIRSADMEHWKSPASLYGRILGFRREASPCLKEIGKRAGVPLITKTADAKNILGPEALSLFEKEVDAAHIYQMLRSAKGGTFRNEYRRGPVIL